MSGALTRKEFIRMSAGAAAIAASGRMHLFGGHAKGSPAVRLGGPLFRKSKDPAEWIDTLKQAGYRAAYCPVDDTATDEEIRAYKSAAQNADIVISEVGVWVNTCSPDEDAKKTRN